MVLKTRTPDVTKSFPSVFAVDLGPFKVYTHKFSIQCLQSLSFPTLAMLVLHCVAVFALLLLTPVLENPWLALYMLDTFRVQQYFFFSDPKGFPLFLA